jgi:hypothetical protein
MVALAAFSTITNALPQYTSAEGRRQKHEYAAGQQQGANKAGVLTLTSIETVVALVTVTATASAQSTGSSAPSATVLSSSQSSTLIESPPTQPSVQSKAASPTIAYAVASSTAGTSAGSSSSINADMIVAIMPKAKSCDGAPFPSECATASQAVGPLSQSFSKYQISNKGAQAAILALIALESGELKYNMPHSGNPAPGKGTRNMQSPNFNSKYANDVLGPAAVSNQTPQQIVDALRNNPATDFGSAAWFLSTQCPSVLQQFATDANGAWGAYLGSGCIGTTDTADRNAYWTAAKKALGVA